MDPNKIGKFIYLLRTEKKLSQYQLADMIPISRQAVSKWERGQTIPDSSTLLRLSEIFDVTINELLNGERLKNDSLKGLETTTLTILDESNRKTKQIKKNLIISFAMIIILLLLFLTYYFINSYNSIKVYTIFGESEHFRVHDGVFIITNQKSYLKIGEIKPNKDITIKNIKLYYDINGKKEIISEDVDIDRIIRDSYGYSRVLFQHRISTKVYLEITYNETDIEQLELTFQRDFSNNNFIFKKGKKFGESITTEGKTLQQQGKAKEQEEIESKQEETKSTEKEEKQEKQDLQIKKEEEKTVLNEEDLTQEESKPVSEEEKIEIIKTKGLSENGNYIYTVQDGSNTMKFAYFQMMNQLVMYENEKPTWTYMIIPKVHICQKQYYETKDLSIPENCKDYILESLGRYVN